MAELPDGTVAGYQCRRVQQFGPTKLRAAVKATAFDADRYVLLLTRPASADLRKEALQHPLWDIEDVEDVSTVIRYDLPTHKAKQLVDTHFPGWTKDFLGIDSPGVWLTAEEFFRPLMRPGAVISHGWTIVGRSAELAAVDWFLDSDQMCLLLSGRGGIGKTRLLREVSTRIGEAIPVFFAAPDTRFQLDDLNLLPEGEFVVMVDDAHNRDDIVALVSSLSRLESHGWKLIVTTRPYSTTRLVGDLAAHGLLGLASESLLDIEDLEIDDTEALASEVLCQEGGPITTARLVAEATRDCPLLTVIAAKLVAAKRLDPRDLGSDVTARSLLIRRFKDTLIRDLGGHSDRQALMDLLELVALVQPIVADDEFQSLAHSHLGIRPERVVRGLHIMEEAGVLARRGHKIRVIPDLFGDFLVASACVDPALGSTTGYAEAVFAEVSGSLAENVIRSVARLDWRLSREQQWDSSVLDGIWHSLTQDLLVSSALWRQATLSSLSDVSYYQPRRALKLARALVRTPPRPEDPSLGLPKVFSADPEYRYAGIPKFLRNATYNLEYVGEVCDLLWSIGRDVAGWLQSDTTYAVRILQDVASIEHAKPLEFLSVIADRAIAWTRDPELGRYWHSPLDVLEPLVATDSRDTRMVGLTMRITPFVVNPDAVRPLRDRSIDTAISLLGHPHPRVGVRAARMLSMALRYPSEQFGRDPTISERSSWTAEFCRELEQLADFLRDTQVDPIVEEELRQAVSWHATYGEETNEAAQSVLTCLQDGRLKARLTKVLTYGLDGHPYLDSPELDYGEIVKQWQSLQREVARDLRRDIPDHVAAVDLVEERIRALTSAAGRPPSSDEPFPAFLSEAIRLPSSAEPFLSILCNEWEEAAVEILTRVARPSNPLTPYTRIALLELRDHRPYRVFELTRQLIDTGIPELVAQTAEALTRSGQFGSISAEELTMIRTLAQHDHPTVRLAVAQGLLFASGMDYTTRLGLITTIPLNGNLQVAVAVASHFVRHGDFNIEEAPPQFISRFLEGLVPCEDLEDDTINEFLAASSTLDPYGLLNFYISRVDQKQTAQPSLSRPFPSQHYPRPRFRQTTHFREIVYRICDWTLHANGYQSFWAPELFALSVGEVDRRVLDYLAHWGGSTDPRRLITLARLLSEMSGNFVWTQVDWVNDLLERAYALGDDCYSDVSAGLQAAVSSAVRIGQPGQPFPADIEQRDRSRTVASSLPLGTPAHRFYKQLTKSAELSIEQSRQQYEEIDDPYR